jgi:DNA-binding response OmpR family regulator
MRELLSESANIAGWDTVVCADHQNGLSAFNKTRFHMALIDLTGPMTARRGFRDLCQTLASQSNLLLAVCGNANDPQEEIWARQLGVWLYLPGVAVEHVEELAAICEQAQLVAGLSAELQ